jgi:3-methyl-2-oxobutanoate hydroxymethyltransferase
VPTEVTAVLREALEIPVIGIGAGPAEGQVLVLHDLLGVTEGRTAKFVKRYGSIGDDTVAAISAYADDVRSGGFPGPEHRYTASPEAVAAARAAARDA